MIKLNACLIQYLHLEVKREDQLASAQAVLIGKAVKPVEYSVAVGLPVEEIAQFTCQSEFTETIYSFHVKQWNCFMNPFIYFLAGDIRSQCQLQPVDRKERQPDIMCLRGK